MESTSGQRSGSSGNPGKRKKVHVGTGAPSRRLTAEPQLKVKVEAKHEAPGQTHSHGEHRGSSGYSTGRSRAGDATARAKREERARRLAQHSRTRRIRLVVVVALSIVVVGGLFALYRSPLFAIKVVDVQGAELLSVETVQTLAAVPEDATLLRYPKKAIIARVEADPWVEVVILTRDFPDTLRIRVTERTPVALVDMGEKFWVVDSTGMVLGEQSFEDTATLIVIRDVQGLDPKPGRRSSSDTLDNALKVLVGIGGELRGKVRAISAPTVDETTLLTIDAIEILMGEAVEVEDKAFLALSIMKEQAGKVVFIDVRSIDNPVSRGL
ncbi:MAG: FtsQ-type POTRA domain-containing protein [Coriobacteriia bacterium]|nr:FtsQ-type POTRA domain-containing protein [Coriobacteriia bacterium]